MNPNHSSYFNRAIGLTGGIATGKSTVARILAKKGYIVIDADDLARKAVNPGTPALKEIVKVFGNHVILQDGSLDRKKMRDIIVRSPKQKERLENIIHPRLNGLALAELVDKGYKDATNFWFYEASLIYEKKREQDFHSIWVCHCPKNTQLERLMKRDKIGPEDALAMISCQMPIEQKVHKANVAIDTNCTLQQLEEKITAILAKI